MPVVLLHGCWPFVREGAYLAAVYGNAHLDLSFGIPFLSRQEMRAVTRAALGAAPLSKLMYSSDGARVPELHWMAAHDGRRILGQVLTEVVADGDLTAGRARRAGEQILRDNAEALYGIAGVRMTRLRDKRALVTGAGGALGRASSLRFAARGCAGGGPRRVGGRRRRRRSHSSAPRVAEAIALVADVREEDQVRAAVATAVQAFGGLDVLFNNAGVMPHQDISFLDADLGLWRTISDINLHGTVLCSKYAVPHLIAAGGGAVVNMSSFLAELGMQRAAGRVRREQGRRRGVDPVDGRPAGRPGRAGQRARPRAGADRPRRGVLPGPEERRQARLDRVPLGRFGRPEDAAALACFLASEDAAWITGQTVVLDGGISSNYL